MLRIARFMSLLMATAILLLFVFRPSVEIQIDPSAIVHDTGHLYVFHPRKPDRLGYFLATDASANPRRSTLLLSENGTPLGPPYTLHETIRKTGQGRFSHWNGAILFSSSDNTVPGQNGRIYTATATLSLLPVSLWSGIAMLVAIALLHLLLERRKVACYLSCTFDSARKDKLSAGIVAAKLLALAALFAISCQPYLTFPTAESWITSTGERLKWLNRGGLTLEGVADGLFVAGTIIGICLVPFVRDWRFRIPLMLFFILAFLMDSIVLNTSGQNLGIDLADTLWRERALGHSVLGSYLPRILGGGILFAILFVVLTLGLPRRWSLSRMFALPSILMFFAVAGVVHHTRGTRTDFPPGFSVPAQFSFVTLSTAGDAETRHPVDYPGSPRPLFKKIVFIVDESVRGDYLSLNNPKLDNTPTLAAASQSMANFGIATSGANCSAAARLFLRIGMQPKELPDVDKKWVAKTTMWDFAKAAGYKTILIDAHSPPAPLFHSYMSGSEARAIDAIRSVSATPWYKRDHEIPDLLMEFLRNDEPSFIAVNKFGVHTDYKDAMPPSFTYETKRDDSSSRLDPAQRLVATAYDRALRWSIDGFFAKILPEAIRDDVLIIYTSDHGQAMFDGGYDTQHCTLGQRIADGEVLVPLFAITGSKTYLAALQREAVRSHNLASHFELFPTLLWAMGYDSGWSAQKYGPNLLDVPRTRERGFLAGGFFSPTARWLTVGTRSGAGTD